MNPYKNFSRKRPWTARILLILLIIVILLSLVRVSLPFVVTSFATYWFKPENVEVNIGDIEISLFDGTFSLNDVAGTNKTGKGFSLGRFAIAWEWRPLFDHKVIIDHIEVDALNIDAMFLGNGDMGIAGIFIAAATNESQSKNNTTSVSMPWDVTVKDIVFSDVTLCMQQFSKADRIMLDYCGQLEKLEWAGNVAFSPSILLADQEVSSSAITNTPLYVQGRLNIQGIMLVNNQLKRKLLKIGTVDVNNIAIETPSNIRIENISVEKVSVMQRDASQGGAQASNGNAQILSFDSFNITPIRFSELNQLSLGTIELTGAGAYLSMNKEGEMDFEQWLPEKEDDIAITQKNSVDTLSNTIAKSFHFSFDEFNFLSKQHMVFIDDRFEVPFSVDIHDIDLRLAQIDSRAPDQSSHVSLALTIGTHGRLTIDSDIKPLSDRLSLNGKGVISGLDMRMVDPLTSQYIGHNIKSGQLDANLKLVVDKGIIDSNIDLSLHQFELKKLSNKDAEQLNSEFGFPLNSSLSLLRDRDNSIRLDLPVTGDIDNPVFDPRDVIIKASSKAITTAVLDYYTPFGLIFAAESLFDIATALRFDPLLFAAGTSDLIPAHETQLDKLATLMRERPGIHLSLCAISNSADRDTLFPASTDNAGKNAGKTEQSATQSESLSKEDLATLEQLAESRSANIKNYVVSKKSITSSRLIECAPEYGQDKIAGVEISI